MTYGQIEYGQINYAEAEGFDEGFDRRVEDDPVGPKRSRVLDGEQAARRRAPAPKGRRPAPASNGARRPGDAPGAGRPWTRSAADAAAAAGARRAPGPGDPEPTRVANVEGYLEYEQPSRQVLLGYTEHGEMVLGDEIGETEDGEPVYAEEMYTEYGDPVTVDDIALSPASPDQPVSEEDINQVIAERRARMGANGLPSRLASEHNPVLMGLGALLAVIVLITIVVAIWADGAINPGGKPGSLATVVIPPGSSSADIGNILDKDGVIHSGSLFPYYVKLQGGANLLPGTYQMPKNEKYGSVINILKKGPQIIEQNLVIPDGDNLFQIAQAVSKLHVVHISAKDFLQVANSGQVTSPYQPPGSKDLEGLVFPATYTVKSTDTPTKILQQMVGAFNNYAQQANLAGGAAALGMSPYQVVEVASMVEKEAPGPAANEPAAAAQIASVIYNRLKQQMALGVDSTLAYGIVKANPGMPEGQADQQAAQNPHMNNPYNTRATPGLPPTPIASVSLDNLRAAANPAPTNFLYYAVTGPNGYTSFATTAAQFNQIQAQCKHSGNCG